MASLPRTRRPLLALVALLIVVAVGYAVQALDNGGPSGHTDTRPGATASASSGSLRTVDASSLPSQAQRTIQLVHQGGPFPYSRDGIVFRNSEHLLPEEASGYYHEYTVPTPGESDRGALRIIAGKDGEIYYTADHYASFVRVRGP